MKIKLIKTTLEMKNEYYDYIKEWEESKEEIVPYSARLLGDTYEEWLKKTIKFEEKETCPLNFVSASTYFLVREDKKIIGAINIRHSLNDYLLKFGGNIGYGIRPSERKQGYASQMLSLGLLIIKQMGIKKVLITCDVKNIGSAKTIIKNGGILENEVQEKNRVIQRYWITID